MYYETCTLYQTACSVWSQSTCNLFSVDTREHSTWSSICSHFTVTKLKKVYFSGLRKCANIWSSRAQFHFPFLAFHKCDISGNSSVLNRIISSGILCCVKIKYITKCIGSFFSFSSKYTVCLGTVKTYITQSVIFVWITKSTVFKNTKKLAFVKKLQMNEKDTC